MSPLDLFYHMWNLHQGGPVGSAALYTTWNIWGPGGAWVGYEAGPQDYFLLLPTPDRTHTPPPFPDADPLSRSDDKKMGWVSHLICFVGLGKVVLVALFVHEGPYQIKNILWA